MNSINDNEIGRLQKSNRNWRRKCQRLRKALRTQKAEIDELQLKIMSCNSEAIEEFADEFEKRCIAGGIYPAFVKRQLDDAKKEMTENDFKE